MQVIQLMLPCRCAECHGKADLRRVELIADSADDVQRLKNLVAWLKETGEAEGAQITERAINIEVVKGADLSPDVKAKAEAARNN